jgi:Rps23 Pro-64 3,4-dihydroxylase Tpa1-like proline 4-hydroxylase
MQVDPYGVGQYVKVIDGIFPKKTLEKFYKICKELDFKDAYVGGGKNSKVNKEIRNTETLCWHRYSKELTHVRWCNYFINATYDAIKKYYIPGAPQATVNKASQIEVLKYKEGGFYTPHVDHFATIPRTISVVTFINDDFDGGEFEMFSPDLKESKKVKPQVGRTIIFPSNFLYPHKANLVKNGTRYAIVIWFL